MPMPRAAPRPTGAPRPWEGVRPQTNINFFRTFGKKRDYRVTQHCTFLCSTAMAEMRLLLAALAIASVVLVAANQSDSSSANTRPAFSLLNADLQNLHESGTNVSQCQFFPTSYHPDTQL